MKDENYPANGKYKIYKQGITLIIDTFAHTNEKDITAIRDYSSESGEGEHEDTPVDGLDQPKLLIHTKNEIPLILGPNKRYLTLDRYAGNSVGEVRIPLKVVTSNKLD